MKRILKRPLLNILENHAIAYPTPSNISYLWNFGSLAAICLVVQLITGIFLAMHYAAHVDYAFASVEHIMRDVPYGWLLRYTHANGASMFFIVVYAHIFRGLYYGSYRSPRVLIWVLGVAIFLAMMATAFLAMHGASHALHDSPFRIDYIIICSMMLHCILKALPSMFFWG